MTSKLKCPFCGAELQEIFGAYMCRHAGCKICCCLLPPCMIESLIQAKQDLVIARKALEDARIFASTHCIATAVKTIDKALETIGKHKVDDNE